MWYLGTDRDHKADLVRRITDQVLCMAADWRDFRHSLFKLWERWVWKVTNRLSIPSRKPEMLQDVTLGALELQLEESIPDACDRSPENTGAPKLSH